MKRTTVVPKLLKQQIISTWTLTRFSHIGKTASRFFEVLFELCWKDLLLQLNVNRTEQWITHMHMQNLICHWIYWRIGNSICTVWNDWTGFFSPVTAFVLSKLLIYSLLFEYKKNFKKYNNNVSKKITYTAISSNLEVLIDDFIRLVLNCTEKVALMQTYITKHLVCKCIRRQRIKRKKVALTHRTNANQLILAM